MVKLELGQLCNNVSFIGKLSDWRCLLHNLQRRCNQINCECKNSKLSTEYNEQSTIDYVYNTIFMASLTHVTKDKDKLQNINDAMEIFESWLRKFELNNLSKENRAYLPLASVEALLPLKEKYKIENKLVEKFLEAYKKQAKGEYKNLRTVSSGEDEPTWDIVRNTELKKLLKVIGDEAPEMWKDDLPTKEHMEIILWAYSPDASKIKKNVSVYEKKLGSGKESEEEEMDTDEEDEEKEEKEKEERKKKDKKEKKPEKGSKRKSSGDSSDNDDDDDESPKKKTKGNS